MAQENFPPDRAEISLRGDIYISPTLALLKPRCRGTKGTNQETRKTIEVLANETIHAAAWHVEDVRDSGMAGPLEVP